jgi:hypothetical protein
MFQPNLGRWMQIDPIAFEGGDANLYRAFSNGPNERLDPAGLDDDADKDERYEYQWGTLRAGRRDLPAMVCGQRPAVRPKRSGAPHP